MIRDHATGSNAGNFRFTSGNNKVQCVSCGVGLFCDVLNVSKRLQQLMKTNSVRVVSLVDENVEVTTDDDRTTVRR